MRIVCSFPLALSFADTFTIPLASMSNVTSICGTPRGAGGMPTRSSWPSSLLSAAISLALEDADGDRRLIVLRRREHLALLGRYGGVAVDQLGHDAAERLDAERQRRNIKQQCILDVTLQHAGLDCGADRDHFVRIDALVRLAAAQLLRGLLGFLHARLFADQPDLIKI